MINCLNHFRRTTPPTAHPPAAPPCAAGSSARSGSASTARTAVTAGSSLLAGFLCSTIHSGEVGPRTQFLLLPSNTTSGTSSVPVPRLSSPPKSLAGIRSALGTCASF